MRISQEIIKTASETGRQVYSQPYSNKSYDGTIASVLSANHEYRCKDGRVIHRPNDQSDIEKIKGYCESLKALKEKEVPITVKNPLTQQDYNILCSKFQDDRLKQILVNLKEEDFDVKTKKQILQLQSSSLKKPPSNKLP